MAATKIQMPSDVPMPAKVEIVNNKPAAVRRDIKGVFHYLDGACTPEQLNATRSLASPNTYGDLNDAQHLTVQDVTGREAEFTLDNSAFCYPRHECAFAEDMVDIKKMTDDMIVEKYYPETEELIQKLTGASLVHVFNHLRRISHGNNPQALGGNVRVHHQAYKVHVDQSWKQVRDHVQEAYGDKAEEMMRQRFQIINVWRPLRTIRKDPLAITDIRTQQPADLLRIDVVLADGAKTSNLAVRYNPTHQWYYKHLQRPDEPLVFKQFDSGERACLGQVLHSAFADEEYEGGEPRYSIEARALVFYENERGIQPEEVKDRGFGAELDK